MHPGFDLGNGDNDVKGQHGIRPGTAHVTFHAPIFPADYERREDLMTAVRAAIASGLPEWMRT